MKSKEYLKSLNKFFLNELLLEMRCYAHIHKIPIINDEGLCFLRQIIMLKKPKRILEIGTAIGYSAIMMASDGDWIVDTIERDDLMYTKALEFIKRTTFSNRINIIKSDALELSSDENYDLIFIDGAKAQYQKFFTKYMHNLNDEGIIISDNLLFHEEVLKDKIESKNLRRIVEKIREYNEWLVNLNGFKTNIYPIGDGMSLSIKQRS